MSNDPPQIDPREDAYLCDRSGEPAQDLRRWAALLGEFREVVPILPTPALPRRGARARFAWRLAVAASLLLAAAAVLFWQTRGQPAWRLEVVSGAPRVESPAGAALGTLAVGSRVTTDRSSSARIRVGAIGWVDIVHSTTVRIVAPRNDEFRMAVDRGTLRAEISAPPRLFVVDMPQATAIDLGCVYTLRVSETGDALLTVESGWVLLESADREALVPEGADAASRPGTGAGSPYYRDASAAFRRSLSLVDFGAGAEVDAALGVVLADARSRDAMTLLTLLGRLDAGRRIRVYDRLAELLPPPPGVTRSGIERGDRAMIDRWWSELRLNIPKKKPVTLVGD